MTVSRYMWDDFHPYVYETHDYGAHWSDAGKGVAEVLRAIVREIAERRAERAERKTARRPSVAPKILDATPRVAPRAAAKAKRLERAAKQAMAPEQNVRGPDVKAKLTKAKLKGKVTTARRTVKKARGR